MGSRNCWANQKRGSPGPSSQRDREDRNLFWVFLGAFCWAPWTSRPIYTYVVHAHIHYIFVYSCACVPCVAARKSLLLTFYLVYVFYGLVHKTHSHTSPHTRSPAAHTHNPFPWNNSLFCRHFLCASLFVRVRVCVCERSGGGWRVGWDNPLLVVVLLVLVVLLVPSSAAPSTKPFSLCLFSLVFYMKTLQQICIYTYVQISMYVRTCACVCVCEANICKFQVFPLRYEPNFNVKLTEICKFSFR